MPFKLLFSLLSLLILPVQVTANGVSIGIGQGDENITAFRISHLWDWQKNWAPAENWSIDGYWEASLSSWNGDKGKRQSNDTMTVVAITPVFTFRYTGFNPIPYLQIGIGASWLSNTEIGNKELSTHFQFEDRAGIGMIRHPWDVNLNFFHFSNGSIKRPNDGVNLMMLNIIYRL